MTCLKWSDEAWDDYLWWQNQDRKTYTKINNLIRDIMRHPTDGIGKPEPLMHQLSGYWSRRIDKANRIVYIYEEDADTVFITQCKFHYNK